MQAVRRHHLGIQLACEIERKNDLGELTLGIGARARVTARQHDIVEVIGCWPSEETFTMRAGLPSITTGSRTRVKISL
jgi:hypothetical protein